VLAGLAGVLLTVLGGPTGCASSGVTGHSSGSGSATGTDDAARGAGPRTDGVLGRYRAVRADAEPALPGTQVAWQLPPQVRARAGYGVRAGDRYAVFGVGPGDPRGGDAEIGLREHARFAVLDLSTGEVTVHPAASAGRTADAAAPVSGGGNSTGGSPDNRTGGRTGGSTGGSTGRGGSGTEDWVVRTEAGPRPAAECPATPDYCWTWTLYATSLPGGGSTRIAQAARPGPQFLLPQVATDLHTVAWLDPSGSADGGSTVLSTWRPGGGVQRITDGLPSGRLSLDGGTAWIGTSDRGGHRLLQVDLATGRTASVTLPVGAADAVVTGGRVAYVRRPAEGAAPGSPTTVEVALAATPGAARPVFSGADVYTLNWAGADQVIVSATTGYLITDGTSTRRLGIDLLDGVHHDAGRVALVQHRAGRQVVVVVP
jgi:hypothetical protein